MPEYSLTGKVSVDKVVQLFQASERQARDTRPVMARILADMRRVEEQIFASGGRRGGGSWRRLADSTVQKKGTTEILRTRGAKAGYSKFPADALFKSLTEEGAEYSVADFTRNWVLFGTEHPYADVIGGQRPFMRFTDADSDRWNGMIAGFLMEPFIADSEA